MCIRDFSQKGITLTAFLINRAALDHNTLIYSTKVLVSIVLSSISLCLYHYYTTAIFYIAFRNEYTYLSHKRINQFFTICICYSTHYYFTSTFLISIAYAKQNSLLPSLPLYSNSWMQKKTSKHNIELYFLSPNRTINLLLPSKTLHKNVIRGNM